MVDIGYIVSRSIYRATAGGFLRARITIIRKRNKNISRKSRHIVPPSWATPVFTLLFSVGELAGNKSQLSVRDRLTVSVESTDELSKDKDVDLIAWKNVLLEYHGFKLSKSKKQLWSSRKVRDKNHPPSKFLRGWNRATLKNIETVYFGQRCSHERGLRNVSWPSCCIHGLVLSLTITYS